MAHLKTATSYLLILLSLVFVADAFAANAGFVAGSHARKPVFELRPGLKGGFAGLEASPYQGLNRWDRAELDANVSVRHVTNLNTSGSGSFVTETTASGRKFVVFDVCGQIDPGDTPNLNVDHTHVAGQTACGTGVLFRFGQLEIRANNYFIEHVKVRHLPESGAGASGPDEGTIQILGDTGGGLHDIVILNTDNNYADDDNLDPFGGHKDVDIFYSIAAYGINCDENTSMFECTDNTSESSRGPTMSSEPDSAMHNFSFQRNLVSNTLVRCPTYGQIGDALFTGGAGDWVHTNNVTYNCGGISALGQPMIHMQRFHSRVLLEGNYFGRGAFTDSKLGTNARYFLVNSSVDQNSEIYENDTQIEPGNLQPAIIDNGSVIVGSRPFTPSRLYEPLAGSATRQHVIDYAGAFPNRRDNISMDVINNLDKDIGRGDFIAEGFLDSIGGLYPELYTRTGQTFAGCDTNPHGLAATGRTKCEEALYQAYRNVTDKKVQVSFAGGVVNATSSEIVSGGQVLYLLINHDDWVSSFGDTEKQAVIDACTGDGGASGWTNEVAANAEPGDVVKDTARQLKWTLDAEGSYSISSNETISCSFPSSLFENSSESVPHAFTFTISNG